MPQSSVSHSQLMDAVHQVAGACKERGILGHLSIDFLTFIEPASVSIHLHYFCLLCNHDAMILLMPSLDVSRVVVHRLGHGLLQSLGLISTHELCDRI